MDTWHGCNVLDDRGGDDGSDHLSVMDNEERIVSADVAVEI